MGCDILPDILSDDDGPVGEVVNPDGAGPICLVCEHASPTIPKSLGSLGLETRHRHSHAVFDIGAETLARHLSERLDAPLVLSRVSRLVYDCNRPPDREDAIPVLVEDIAIPGNRDISAMARAQRVNEIYHPFHELVSAQLDRMGGQPAFVTIHSFTPAWLGQRREVEIGLLHDAQTDLAHAMYAEAPTAFRIELNQPYSAVDGVTHTLRIHAEKRRLPNVMIEVRNDLLSTADQISTAGEVLEKMLTRALAKGVAV